MITIAPPPDKIAFYQATGVPAGVWASSDENIARYLTRQRASLSSTAATNGNVATALQALSGVRVIDNFLAQRNLQLTSPSLGSSSAPSGAPANETRGLSAAVVAGGVGLVAVVILVLRRR